MKIKVNNSYISWVSTTIIIKSILTFDTNFIFHPLFRNMRTYFIFSQINSLIIIHKYKPYNDVVPT